MSAVGQDLMKLYSQRILALAAGIPITTTVMGLGVFPSSDPLSLDMLGMHGSVYANYAVDEADLLIIGPHRRQILQDVFTGTTAERTIRGSDRP